MWYSAKRERAEGENVAPFNASEQYKGEGICKANTSTTEQITSLNVEVVELADTHDSGSCSESY